MKKNISKKERELFLKALDSLPNFLKDEPLIALPKKKNIKKKREVDARIDLHGMLPEDALLALHEFIDSQKRKGSKTLLIIHGKGAGILKNAVLNIIHTHNDVFNYKEAPPRLGGEGATVIWINRARK